MPTDDTLDGTPGEAAQADDTPREILRSTIADVHRALMRDEIQMIVAEAIADGGTLSIGTHVERLATIYPEAGRSRRSIADELILAATQERLPVEIEG